MFIAKTWLSLLPFLCLLFAFCWKSVSNPERPPIAPLSALVHLVLSSDRYVGLTERKMEVNDPGLGRNVVKRDEKIFVYIEENVIEKKHQWGVASFSTAKMCLIGP
ncbi:hypothetical protein NPIL_695301 [Nephila pilipes]|uniref:Uncharacterized protein n=1 Tax=Nephila pilipes TaxID=299642 RepID=A0A8X6QBZ0_NEPPI|nr:hypothetical protein NPIL_695301 [Nephila pilipes]